MSKENVISVLLFDLGGVLLHLEDAGTHFGLGADDTEFLETWVHADSVREFESGNASFEEFAVRIVEEIRLPYDGEEFLRRFHAWPGSLYAGVTDLLEHLATRYRCALLSNTNAVHWGRADIAGILASRFDQLFLSFQTGILKPDRAAFDQVIDHYSCEPQEILFVDDTPSNIAAATNLGIQARLVKGEGMVNRTLSEHGIL